MVAIKSTLDDISTTDDLQRDKINLGGFSARLQSLMDEKGWKQVDLSRVSGESTSTISNYIRALKMPSAPALIAVAKVFGVRPEWLLLGTGDRFEQSPEALGDFAIPIVDTVKALETGLWYDLRVFDGNLLLPDLAMEHMGRRDVQGLIVIINEGDIMEPQIADGAQVVVDARDIRMREGLWACLIGPNLAIRRLRRTADGVEAIPYNKAYPVERFEGDMRNDVALIGRVLWAATNLK